MINTAKKMIYHAFSSIFPIREVDSSFLSIVARMLFRLFGYAVIDYGGVKLKVTPHELAERFFLQGLHLNPFLTSAVNQVLAEGGVFLDIGANHGVLSLLAARNKNVRVFAFEPSPRELRSCPIAWCNSGLVTAFSGQSGRDYQAATAGSMMV